MNRLELFSIMREIVLTVTGISECILDDQNYTAPSGEYCTIEPFSNLRQIGRGAVTDEEVDAEDGEDYYDIEETLTTLIEATVSVNFYRGDARNYAQKLMFCDERSDIHEKLLVNNLGWMRTDAANNLTTLNSAQQEPRSQINIYIQFEQDQSYTVQQIYHVEFEIQNEDGDIISTGEEIIPNP